MKSWSWNPIIPNIVFGSYHTRTVISCRSHNMMYQLFCREWKPSVALSWGLKSQISRILVEDCMILSSGYSDVLLYPQKWMNPQAKSNARTTNAKSVSMGASIQCSFRVVIQSTQDVQGMRRIDIRSHLGYDLVCCTTCFGKNLAIRCCVCCYCVAPQKIG